MKQLLIIPVLLLSFFLHAQPYTYAEEEGIQQGIMQTTSHHKGAVFVGYDINWVNNMSAYLQHNLHYSYKEGKCSGNVWCANLKPTSAKRSVNAFIYVQASYNKDMKVTGITITGTVDELIELFLWYWEDTHISLNMLKSGCYIYQDFSSDRIIFNWKGDKPIITIVRSPDAVKVSFKGQH